MRLLDKLQHIADLGRPTFGSFHYTAKGTGEEARHTILLGVDMSAVYKREIEILETVKDGLSGIEKQAAVAMIASRKLSLEQWAKGEYHPDATSADSYVQFATIPGVKIHKPTMAIHVVGQAHAKKVIASGTYKQRSYGAFAGAKKALERDLKLPGGKIRQFDLTFVETARLFGETIVLR